MGTNGSIYLHENGSLIYKHAGYQYSEDACSPGSFVKHIWPLDFNDRATGWLLLLESFSLGANKNEVEMLAKKWGMDFADLIEFLARQQFNEQLAYLVKLFVEQIFNKTINKLISALEALEVKLKSVTLGNELLTENKE